MHKELNNNILYAYILQKSKFFIRKIIDIRRGGE